MKKYLLLTAAPFALATPAMAQLVPATPSTATASTTAQKAANPAATAPAEELFSTGVAKGRDRLDSATSTSAMKETEIEKIGARSLGDILRNIPGIRTESSTGDGNSNYTIRGLPLAAGGSKFMQIEEDGLPVLEFGDFFNVSSDIFIRADFNLSAVEAIRGGSASTFASNSPGGVINLISKTGDVEGGAIQLTGGLDYDMKRLDFDYGGKISDSLRFHFGGFYRTGEGARHVGYNAYQGGQLKFNVTKQFADGYIRLSGKYLDDRSPQYMPGPIAISGTNDKPIYQNVANFDIKKDSVLSRYIPSVVTLDGNNQPIHTPVSDGMHAVVKSIGLEAQFDVAGWSVTEKARYSKISGSVTRDLFAAMYQGNALPASLGAGTGRLSYATGPNAGQVITSPNSINGNGLIGNMYLMRVNANSLDNFTNDVRINRAFKLGNGEFTVTGGVYKALQKINNDWLYTSIVQDVAGGGNSSLIDYTDSAGVAQTQNGVLSYSLGGAGTYRRTYDVQYDVTAPYGSLNYHIGKIALGGSIRYDIGKVRGLLYGSDLGGGRLGITSYDFNGDGKISIPESKTAFIPVTAPAPVHYGYHYLSYSVGINYRVAEPLAVFARYSRGARANADKILFATSVSTTDGSMADPANGYDIVTQTEGGVKYRKGGFTFNATAFLANTQDTNLQAGTGTQTHRNYRAYGAEFEAGFRRGPFNITGGLTYTHATIVNDTLNAAVAGQVPRHQPKFIFEATPQYETRTFSVGANVIGNTSSYSQDTNLLRMPGYTMVNPFVQFRPADRVELMVNANNVFNTLAFFEVTQASVPANGVGQARVANGRTITASLRYDF
ncbi:TonB-dependent receptor [Sphingomonas sp. AR_OL41]|uniref:TonB-dependent receptor domain-containing protein n=1 Tax=Sphingomonas sp. AR_OL41 TaxID=3042729 RepID=UPI002480112E|nr:TonB-dependent receptor [Sphingomonas sp. AR_OL41]MDH7974408.1 TonB-dependent receptor [Sphingomonas sp. AR_OL41]